MLSAWAYAEGADDPRALTPDAVPGAVAVPDTLVWIDALDPTPSELESLTAGLRLNPLAVEDVVHGGQRTKLERYGDHFHLVTRDCALTGHHLEAREVDLLFGDGWIVTVHRTRPGGLGPPGHHARPGGRAEPGVRTERRSPTDPAGRADPAAAPRPEQADVGVGAGVDGTVAEARRRYELQRREHGSNDEGFVLWAVLDVIVDRYFTVVDRIDERLEDLEEIVFAGETGGPTPREVFTLRRAMVTFRRAAAPLREVIAQMLRREVDVIGDAALMHLQDVYDHVLRVADLVESQRDVLTGLLEAHLAVASNRMNEVMKMMSSWGAILLGATLIAGIYGMNFSDMPELRWRFGYPLALGLMAILTLALYRMFRRRGWL